MSEVTHDLGAKYLVDPYLNWAKAEGVPIVEGATLDLLTLETKPWARFGVNGTICHVEGRCDFLSAFLFELAPDAGAHLFALRLKLATGSQNIPAARGADR
jgi:hypothetical protein